MPNHIHLILKAVPDEIKDWTDEGVMRRWLSIFRGPLIVHRYLNGEQTSQAEKQTISSLVGCWRTRLTEISWFMKLCPWMDGIRAMQEQLPSLNEPIARQVNKEDHCTGHFWDRFLLLQNLHSLHPCKLGQIPLSRFTR